MPQGFAARLAAMAVSTRALRPSCTRQRQGTVAGSVSGSCRFLYDSAREGSVVHHQIT